MVRNVYGYDAILLISGPFEFSIYASIIYMYLGLLLLAPVPVIVSFYGFLSVLLSTL